MIIAHRGASKERPENTLSAFKLAFSQGADGIEGDFHLTKDNQIVCIHDATTARVADTNLVVKDSTLAELKKLDVGSWFNSAFKGETIPTLNEVLEILPSEKKLFLEIKCGVEIIPHLVALLNNYKINLNQLVIISFNREVLRNTKQQIKLIKTLLLSDFKVAKIQGKLTPSAEEILKFLAEIKANGFSSSAPDVLDKNYIHFFTSSGYEYHLWTIDEQKVAENFIKLGVHSITTNTPKKLEN